VTPFDPVTIYRPLGWSNWPLGVDIDHFEIHWFRATRILLKCSLFTAPPPPTTQAIELAAQASEKSKFKDWWWKVQLGKCYHRLGMFRDAEKQYVSALKQQIMVDTVLLLGKVCQLCVLFFGVVWYLFFGEGSGVQWPVCAMQQFSCF